MLLKGIGMPNIQPKKIKKIHIIINPASGKIEPILPVINQVLQEAKLDWEVFVTKKPKDAASFAKEALKNGVDAVGVYGGDGTVMEVVGGMMGSNTPLAILPGGTANVLATELKIPKDLKAACELIVDPSSHQLRMIDAATFHQRHFILRLGMGFEADMVKGADRSIKNRFGRLAYVLSSAAALKKIEEVKYNLNIDGKMYEEKGITCIVANSGNLGFSDLSLGDDFDVSDGLLDVIIVRRINLSLLGYIMAVLVRKRHSPDVEVVQHWQGKDIKVSATPEQMIICDGEASIKGPLHAKIIPDAVKVIVPKLS